MADDLVDRLRQRSLARLSLKRPTKVDHADAALDVEAAARIEALETALAEARRQALEEAAKVARDCAIYDANDQLLNSDIRATCAQAIRALASEKVKK